MKNSFSFNLTEEQKTRIINRWNKDYVKRLLAILENFSDKWQLSRIELIPYYSQNCIFTCYSELYGDAVIKIGYGSLENEINSLCELRGRNVCEVFEADMTHNVILEQRITPGSSLLEKRNQKERIDVFASLFEKLHVVPKNSKKFLTIEDEINSKLEYIQSREDCRVFSGIVEKALTNFESVNSKYKDKKLLHGDFHHENILLSADGNYTIVDPKGYVGDPVFDVARFILLEFSDNLTDGKENEIFDLVAKIEERLHIPSEILIQCLFLDNVVFLLCSDLECGETMADSQFIIDNIFAAEQLLGSM